MCSAKELAGLADLHEEIAQKSSKRTYRLINTESSREETREDEFRQTESKVLKATDVFPRIEREND